MDDFISSLSTVSQCVVGGDENKMALCSRHVVNLTNVAITSVRRCAILETVESVPGVGCVLVRVGKPRMTCRALKMFLGVETHVGSSWHVGFTTVPSDAIVASVPHACSSV